MKYMNLYVLFLNVYKFGNHVHVFVSTELQRPKAPYEP
ncbi:hypothetical protein F383_35102 [Gossypium arboreum]|uniref:Uncharacterized protein n=1 Tax=Gossypium arboreum TaxID=29729 RepID=A0A0B0PPW4_GOSAR|nr:hypothetical protein F383_35102 [Gossypium arboreum]